MSSNTSTDQVSEQLIWLEHQRAKSQVGSSSVPSVTSFDLEESNCLIALWRESTYLQKPPSLKVNSVEIYIQESQSQVFLFAKINTCIHIHTHTQTHTHIYIHKYTRNSKSLKIDNIMLSTSRLGQNFKILVYNSLIFQHHFQKFSFRFIFN